MWLCEKLAEINTIAVMVMTAMTKVTLKTISVNRDFGKLKIPNTSTFPSGNFIFILEKKKKKFPVYSHEKTNTQTSNRRKKETNLADIY